MSKRRRVSWILCSGVTLAIGLVIPAGAATRPYVRTTPQSERTAVKLVHWTTNVAVSYGNGFWTFKSDGEPASNFVATNYAVPSNPLDVSAQGATIHTAASVLTDQNYSYTLPLTPKYSSSTTVTNQGPIGFLLDGAALYNPYEANHSTVATSDNFVASVGDVTASFLDDCDGHPGPGGQYHYHGLPACLVAYATMGSTQQVTSVTSLAGATTPAVQEVNAAAKRPVILGFAFDGYGIYDNVAMNGSVVPVSALDRCNGIFSPVPGYPHGVYHYVLENVKGSRSSIGCYHGVVSSAYTRALEDDLSDTNSALVGAPPPRTHVESARSLAANVDEDNILVAMLRLQPWSHDC